MPFRDYPEYLRHILASIDHIETFIEGMTPDQVRGDRKTEAAVERELQIVTEAAARLGDEAENLCPGPDWKSIRGLGNILRHAYDHVDPDFLWKIFKEDLPPLREYVRLALARLA